MQVKTIPIPAPTINNSLFPHRFDEFISALSVCEIFLFNDKNSKVITRQMRNSSEVMFNHAEDLIRRIYQKFPPGHIEQIKDKQFIDSLKMIYDFYTRYELFGRLKFIDEQNNVDVTSPNNMWENFAKKTTFNVSLSRWQPDREFIDLYRNYRKGKKTETATKEVDKEKPLSLEDEIFNNFTKDKIPTPLFNPFSEMMMDSKKLETIQDKIFKDFTKDKIEFRRKIDPKKLEFIQQTKEGKYKEIIQKIVHPEDFDEDGIPKPKSTKQEELNLNKIVEDTNLTLQKICAGLENLEKKVVEVQEKQEKLEMPKSKGFWQKITGWFN